jgi:hypothetical protein
VASASASGFIHDLALANERAALFYHSCGDMEKIRVHAQAAVTHYEAWEAFAKSAALRETLLSPKVAAVTRKVFASEN